MKAKTLAKAFGMVLLTGLMAAGMTGCAGAQTVQLGENDEFIFTGQMKANNGRTLNLKLTGNKNDDSMLMTVDEMPAMSLTGHYTKEDGKGYKMYFDDISESFAYTQYDTDKKDMTFKTNVNMGTYGTERVEFTFHDPEFASEYDGVGLGKTPPVFDMTGWVGGVIEDHSRLVCQEDGSLKLDSTWMTPREGTWEYDEANNVYTITFTEKSFDKAGVESYPWKRGRTQQGEEIPQLTTTDLEAENYFMGPIQTEYDESTGTYTMTVEYLWSAGVWNEITEYECSYTD